MTLLTECLGCPQDKGSCEMRAGYRAAAEAARAVAPGRISTLGFVCPDRWRGITVGTECTTRLTWHSDEYSDSETVRAVVIMIKRRKAILLVHGDDRSVVGNKNGVIQIYPDRLNLTGRTHKVCVTCDTPMGWGGSLMEKRRDWCAENGGCSTEVRHSFDLEVPF